MAIDAASLVLNVDSTQVTKATGEVEQLTQASQKVEDQLKQEAKAHDKVGAAARAAAQSRDDKGKFVKGSQDRTRAIRQEDDALVSMLRSIKNLAIGGTIGYQIGRGIRAMIDNTIEAEQVQAQLEARLKSTKGAAGMTLKSLNDLSAGLMELSTFDDEAIGRSEALLLTFQNIGANIFPRAEQAILNVATAMGTDLEGATRMVGKALNEPVRGIMSLTRAGVQFSNEEKTLIKNLVDAGQRAEAQAIIFGKLETKMGGAAEAARNTLGGSLSHLKNTFHNLLEGDAAGEGVKGTVVAINNLATTLNDPDVKQGFQSLTQGILGSVGAFAQFVSWSNKAIDSGSEFITSVLGGASDAAKTTQKLREVADVEAEIADRAQNASTFVGRLARGWAGAANIAGLGTIKGSSDKELANRKAALDASIKMDRLLGLSDEKNAKRASDAAAATGTGVTPPTGEDTEDPGSKSDREAAAKRASDAAKKKAEDRAAELQALRDSLRNEEQVIDDSYAARQAIIDSHVELTAEDRKKMSDDSRAQYDKEKADLAATKGAEFEQLRLSLRSEEQVIQESYVNRLAIILANTEEGSAIQKDALAKLDANHAEELQSYKDSLQQKKDALYDGLLSEEELEAEYQQRRRDEIMKSTQLTEEERRDLILRLERETTEKQLAIEKEKNQAMAQVGSDMFGAIAQLAETYSKGHSKQAKRAFEISKAASTAQAIINTYEAATGAYASMVKIPYVGPVLGAAAAAAAIIAGIANVRQIQSQQFTEHDQGGRIPPGKIGVVGEYGPEFVRGPAAITARQLTQQALLGGGNAGVTLNSTFNINSDGSSSSTQSNADRENSMRQFKELVDMRFRDLVNQEQRAGGSLWRMQHG